MDLAIAMHGLWLDFLTLFQPAQPLLEVRPALDPLALLTGSLLYCANAPSDAPLSAADLVAASEISRALQTMLDDYEIGWSQTPTEYQLARALAQIKREYLG